MTSAKKSAPDKKNVTTIRGDVVDSVIVTGDNNTTFFQKIINYIFPSEKETLEQRNRRILLGHVENAWIKGVLDASLHGAALLDLGIKQDPEAVTKYPWVIKRESTKETLPAGTSMLEIFDSIGMGRSLLILGAPGSGKTTMLLELARQLIAHAREDVTYPIPMVFNLASWTEKLSLADWLAQELNNLYSVPRKTAPDWVKGDKLLLLLDGLDELRQESRAKCVEAINTFRKEHGLTSLAVCSRSQDYADLNAKLSFEGAIEVQPLTEKQIAEFFNRFGKEIAGIKQVLKKDSALREMAETPLFLSIMIMAYWDKQVDEIPVFTDMKTQRKYLFDHYIERMFDRYQRPSHKFELKPNKKTPFKKQDVLHWLSWFATRKQEERLSVFFIENLQSNWLDSNILKMSIEVFRVVLLALIYGVVISWAFDTWYLGLGLTLVGILIGVRTDYTKPANMLKWNWWTEVNIKVDAKVNTRRIYWPIIWLFTMPITGTLIGSLLIKEDVSVSAAGGGIIGLIIGLVASFVSGLRKTNIENNEKPDQSIKDSIKYFLLAGFVFGSIFGCIGGGIFGVIIGLGMTGNWIGVMVSGIMFWLIFGFLGWMIGGIHYGGGFLVFHFLLRWLLYLKNKMPFKLVPFLDHCVDLIFLRRVGGGYIFIHRLLMEHFAEMYVETPTSKGN